MTSPDLRHDPQSGRWSAVAPGRHARPGARQTTEEECPFCAGHEHLTPPETLLLGDGPTGWDVRVVPNRYPALTRQEVVVHGPEHHASFAAVPDATLERVAEAWQRRAHDAGGDCFPFVNEGGAAGASQRHTHSQLAWLPEPRTAGGLATAFTVLERDGVELSCPAASRAPYELRIAPLRPEPDGLRSDLLAPALKLLAAAIRRLHDLVDGDLPWNAWLLPGDPWRLEVLPRTTRIAGLELGADVWVTTVAPAGAAAALGGPGR